MPLHWKCSILTTGPPGTSPIIFWSNRYFYLFVKHLHSPCSAPYIIHCMLQIQHVWALMAAEGWGNRSRQRFNNLHGGTDRARKPSQAAGLQGLCLQHPCHELHEVFWVSEGEVSWPRWHLPTQDASQVWVNLTLAPPSAPVSPGGAGCQGGRQAGGLTSWVWLRGEIQPVRLLWAEKWAEPPQPPPTTHAAPPFPSNFSVFEVSTMCQRLHLIPYFIIWFNLHKVSPKLLWLFYTWGSERWRTTFAAAEAPEKTLSI